MIKTEIINSNYTINSDYKSFNISCDTDWNYLGSMPIKYYKDYENINTNIDFTYWTWSCVIQYTDWPILDFFYWGDVYYIITLIFCIFIFIMWILWWKRLHW